MNSFHLWPSLFWKNALFLYPCPAEPVYRFILHPGQLPPPPPLGWSCLWAACPPGVKIPQGILPLTWAACPRGWSCLWAACPPRVKIPWPGQLAPHPQKTWQNNAERFYFFKIKILIVETRENWSLHVCAYASFSWQEEIEGWNIYSGLRSLQLCQKTWQTPFKKTIYHLIDFPIKQSFEYY